MTYFDRFSCACRNERAFPGACDTHDSDIHVLNSARGNLVSKLRNTPILRNATQKLDTYGGCTPFARFPLFGTIATVNIISRFLVNWFEERLLSGFEN